MQVTPPKKIKFSDLKTRILNPSLTSNYLVEITPKKEIADKMSSMGAIYNPRNTFDFLSIPCSEASLPGSSLATIDISNDYRGISEKHAYRRLYDDTLNLTFYVDATAGNEYYVIKFFEGWLAHITNQNFDTIQKPTYGYRVKFPEKYYADAMTIQKFERNFDSISNESKPTPIKYEFYNAYPLNLNSIPLSYDGSEVLKCSVDFTFSRYKVVRSDYVPSSGSSSNPNAPAVPELNNTTTSPEGATTSTNPENLFRETRDSFLSEPDQGFRFNPSREVQIRDTIANPSNPGAVGPPSRTDGVLVFSA